MGDIYDESARILLENRKKRENADRSNWDAYDWEAHRMLNVAAQRKKEKEEADKNTAANYLKGVQEEVSGELADEYFSNNKSLKYLDQDGPAQWGKAPFNKALTELYKADPNNESKIEEAFKATGSAIFRPAAYLADSALSTVLGGLTYASELGLEAAGAMEDYAKKLDDDDQNMDIIPGLDRLERKIGATLIGGVSEILGAGAEGTYIGGGALRGPKHGIEAKHIKGPRQEELLAQARAKGAVAEGEEGFFNTKIQDVEDLKKRAKAAEDVGVQPVRPPKFPETDINVVARQVNPALFDEYDAKVDYHNDLSKRLEELQPPEDHAEVPGILKKDPALVATEEAFNENFNRLKELESEVQKAYADARESIKGQEVQPTLSIEDIVRQSKPALFQELEAKETYHQELIKRLEEAQPPADRTELPGILEKDPVLLQIEEAYKENLQRLEELEIERQDAYNHAQTLMMSAEDAAVVKAEKAKAAEKATRDAEEAVQRLPAEPVPDIVKPKETPVGAPEGPWLAEKGSVANDVEAKLIAIGLPEAEAQAAGIYWESHYNARAYRFKGKLGTGLDLYKKESPDIVDGDKSPSKESKADRILNQYGGKRALEDVFGRDVSAETISEANKKLAYLELAQKLDTNGIDPKRIRLQTGWFKSPLDGKWKYEISDADAKLTQSWENLPESEPFKPETKISVGEVLEHSAAYDLYPDLKDVNIVKRKPITSSVGEKSNLQGWLSDDRMTIYLNPEAKDVLSTLLHEVQHWIQRKEGFARGGSASTVLEKLSPTKLKALFEKEAVRLNKELEEAETLLNKARVNHVNVDIEHGRALVREAETLGKYASEVEEAYKDGHLSEGFYTQIKKDFEDALKEAQDYIKESFKKLFEEDAGHVWGYDSIVKKSFFDEFYNVFSSKDPISLDDYLSGIFDGISKGKLSLYELNAGTDLKTLNKQLGKDKVHELYKALAGEIEARDVQARQKLTDEERRATEPLSSQTYDPDDVTVSFQQNAKGVTRGSLEVRKGERNILRLFKERNASTFFHESGHQWLEELVQDASHAEAPTELLEDMVTVNKFLNRDGSKPITVAQHEKFARALERYLREGKAPSPELEGIFERFKEWLMAIYESVADLRVSLSPEMREVFDRLSSEAAIRKKEALTPEAYKAEISKNVDLDTNTVTILRQDGTKSKHARLPLIKGDGEAKTRGLANRIDAELSKDEMVEDMEEGAIPEYEAVRVKEMALKAIEMTEIDPQNAYEIAMGAKKAPVDMTPESFWIAVKNQAIRNADAGILQDLAHSRLVEEATTMGQRLRSLREDAIMEDPTKVIRSVEKARREYNQKMTNKQLQAHITPQEAQQLATLSKDVKDAFDAMTLAEKPARDAWEAGGKKGPQPVNQALRNKWGNARLDFADYKESLYPDGRTWYEKAWNHTQNVAGLLRGLQTGVFDFSAFGVQGMGMISTKHAWKGFGEMLQYFASEAHYRQLEAYIISHPNYQFSKKAKLGLVQLSEKLDVREEAIRSTLLEQANTYLSEKTGVPNLIRSTSRAYTGYLNYVRFQRFNELLEASRAMGIDVTLGHRNVENLAEVVNNFTGRGNIGKMDRQASFGGALNMILYSPRNTIATIQMFNPYTYLRIQNPIARRAAIRQMLGFIAFQGALYGLARSMGYGVDLNPISQHFGQIQVDDQWYDFTGGKSGFVKFLSRYLTGRYVDKKGELHETGENFGTPTRADLAIRYARGKLSPLAGIIADASWGKDPVGRDFEIGQELIDKSKIIWVSSILDTFQNDPDGTIALLPLLTVVLGAGVNSPLPPLAKEGLGPLGEPARTSMLGFEDGFADPHQPIYQALNDINYNVNSLFPGKTINGVKLTDDQYHDYIAIAGNMTRQVLIPLIESPSWANMPKDIKTKLVKTIVNKSKTYAQGGVMAQPANRELLEEVVRKKIPLTDEQRAKEDDDDNTYWAKLLATQE